MLDFAYRHFTPFTRRLPRRVYADAAFIQDSLPSPRLTILQRR